MGGSRNLCQGGGAPGPTARKQLCLRFNFSPQLIIQFNSGLSMIISKKTIIFQGFRGGPTFSRWGPTFSTGGGGGSNFFKGGLNANLYRNP